MLWVCLVLPVYDYRVRINVRMCRFIRRGHMLEGRCLDMNTARFLLRYF